MTFQELETQLLILTPIEKAQVIEALMKTVGEGSKGITKTSDVMGGDACIAHTRLPVWLLVSLRRQGATDAELLKNYPQLVAADLVNVWAYADAHAEEINHALGEYEAAMQAEL